RSGRKRAICGLEPLVRDFASPTAGADGTFRLTGQSEAHTVGARSCGERVLHLTVGGHMRVLLAGPAFEQNLSIRYLASSVQAKRHQAPLAVFNSADDVETVAGLAGEADIVGLSVCFQSRAQEFLTLARRIKQLHPEKLIVAGGHYASCSAQA